MPEIEEYDLRPDPEEAPDDRPPEEERSFGLAIAAVALVLVAGGGVAYWVYRRPPAPAPTPVATAVPPVATPTPGPEAFGLPSVDQSDGLVRELAQGLSSHPLLGLWLGQQDLVRLFVNVVDLVSKGESPRATLGFLAPKGGFGTMQRKGVLVIDGASYARYDFFAQGVAALDMGAAAAAFRRSLPLLEAAYRELGYPEGGFERALRQGVDRLLAVPALDTEVAVKPVRRGNLLLYEYADPALEALSPAQKHLLRMGPANVRRIQQALRGFLSALG
jgi:hypothetical protein